MKMKQYKAVFFDWDGTAVSNRRADAGEVLAAMKKLLQKGTKLIIVSGTTYENICSGELEHLFTAEELSHLFLGLARGNFNYGYGDQGELVTLHEHTPTCDQLLVLHEACYKIHAGLIRNFNLSTDILFSRPNYCKIDLMVGAARSSSELFMQADEVDRIEELLKEHQITGGLVTLMEYAAEIGKQMGVVLKGTTDAKYLEVGYTTKSDNIRFFMKYLEKEGIELQDCCFWGDEFGAIAPGIWGSDSQMIIDETKQGDFFSVSDMDLPLPEPVVSVGGGISSFLQFLHSLNEGE